MAKKQVTILKLLVKGASANPAPPIGPALGAKGLNIMDFCKQFNARTKERAGEILPVVITINPNKSFDFIIKAPPVAVQLMGKAKLKKGSAEPNRKKVSKVSWKTVEEIAENKMKDLNALTIESAMKMVAGTARSMGITISGKPPWVN